MKKFPSILAMLLTLAMLIVPMSAMAEEATTATPVATVIQIMNPVVSAAGETRSMPGLGLQLALCENSDASLVQLIADVLVNGQNAGSAMLQLDSAMNLIGLLGGMSSAYSVNLDEIAAAGMASSGIPMDQLNSLATMLSTWTLPDTIGAIVNNHMANFTSTDMGTSANANGVELSYVKTSGDITDMVIEIMTAIEQDELVLAIAQMSDPTLTSLDLVSSSGIGNGNGFRVDATTGTDATGNIIDCIFDVIIYSGDVDAGTLRVTFDGDATDASNINGNFGFMLLNPDGSNSGAGDFQYAVLSNGYNLTGSVVMDGTEVMSLNSSLAMTDAQDSFTLNVSATSAYSTDPTGFNVSYTNVKNGMSGNVTLTADYFEYGATTPLLNLTGSYAVTDTGLTVSGSLSNTDTYGYTTGITVNELTIDAVNGGFTASVSVIDSYATVPTTMALSLTPAAAANGAIYSGVLNLAVSDEYSDVTMSADVNLLTADVNTADFYIDPALAINFLTMTEDQAFTAETELSAVLENLGATIMSAYPELFE